MSSDDNIWVLNYFLQKVAKHFFFFTWIGSRFCI